MAVHYNPITKEPYLQLPAPCANIIITPYRKHQIKETALVMTEILNDTRVYSWLEGPPYPYLPEHGEDWVRMKIEENEAVVSTLQREFEAEGQPHSGGTKDKMSAVFFDSCPFLCIREVTKRTITNGAPLQDILIGYTGLLRYPFYEIRQNSWELALVQAHNNQLPAGHKDIVWGLGSMFHQNDLLDCMNLAYVANKTGRLPLPYLSWKRHYESDRSNCH
jgi:hypothetical protein